MKKIVVDMQNFLFGDSIAAAFKNSDYDIDVIRAESPKDTIELCRVYQPFVLVMEVTAYTPWLFDERCGGEWLQIVSSLSTPRMAMSFGIREFPPPSIWRHASVIWYAWLSSQAMMATGLGSDCSHVMSCAVS